MFTINSIFKLNLAITERAGEIKLTGEDPTAFELFFKKYKLFSEIESLEIDYTKNAKDELNLFSIGQKINFFIKKGLKSLIIKSEKLVDLEIFLYNLENECLGTRLEMLNIQCAEYKSIIIPSLNSEDSLNEEKVKEKCKGIIDKNKEIRAFLSRDFAKELADLNITDNFTSESIETEMQAKHLWMLGCQSCKIIDYGDYSQLLEKDCGYKITKLLAYNWSIGGIVDRDAVDQLKIFYKFLNLDLNARYAYADEKPNNEKKRLIDWADGKHPKSNIISWLIENNASLMRDYDPQDTKMPAIPSNRWGEDDFHKRFPLNKAWENGNDFSKKALLNKHTVYDALAWYIVYNDFDMFHKIQNEAKIVMILSYSEKIPEGRFAGFTLIQLMVFYSRTELFINTTCESKTDEIKILAESTCPIKDKFKFSGWRLFEVIIFKGLANECETLISAVFSSDFKLTNGETKNLAELLLTGLSAELSEELYQHEPKKRRDKSNEYKRVIKQLISHNWIQDTSFKNLILKHKGQNASISLLHFSIFHACFSVIKDYLSISVDLLNQTVSLSKINNVNALQLALIWYPESIDKDDCFELIQFLKQSYQDNNLLEWTLAETLTIGDRNENILQHILVTKSELLRQLAQWPESPVNAPFLRSHLLYPEYLPIHVAIINTFSGGNSLDYLLAHEKIDFSHQFPAKGVPHYLTGLYPLSAIFHDQYPLKNSVVEYKKLAGYTNLILPVILSSKSISVTKKKQIMTQALAEAVLRHDLIKGNNHANEIQMLLDSGANMYANFGQRIRILDLAFQRGMLGIFGEVVDDSFEPLDLPNSSNLIENKKSSELDATYTIIEDNCGVITLSRKNNGRSTEHVFLIVEFIKNGLSYMYFADFVQVKKEGESQGKVRVAQSSGALDSALLCEDRDKFKIISAKGLITQSWPLSMSSCQKLMETINKEKGAKLPYRLTGDKSSIPGRVVGLSSGNGDNCYTWARKKLLSTKANCICNSLVLSLTFSDWVKCVRPSSKLPEKKPSWTNYALSFFNNKNFNSVVILASASYLVYNNSSSDENSSFNL